MKSILSPIALAMFITLATIACSNNKTQDESTTEATTKSVLTAQPTMKSIDLQEEYTANVEAFVRNNIAPQAPNRIARIMVEVGQKVSKGQVIAVLDDANLKQQEIRLSNIKADFDRTQELYNVGGISRSQYEAQKSNYEVTAAAYHNLRQNTMLTTPTAGVVTARNYDNGDMYTGAMPIVVVEQVSPLKIVVNASEKYFPQIQKGMDAEVRLDVFPGDTFVGKVGLIHPTIDPATRTFKVEIHLRNENSKVRPGMFASVTLQLGSQEMMMIPDTSVGTLPGTSQKFVYIIENGKAVHRNISVGSVIGTEVIVTEGLSLQDQIIISGLSGLKSGDTVSIQ